MMIGFNNAPALLILVAGVLGGVGAYWSSAQQAKSDKDSVAKSQEIIAKSNEIAKLATENAVKSDEIAKLTTKLSSTVTGGDGFCYVSVANAGIGSPNSGILAVSSKGEYPLYDVVVRVTDLNIKLSHPIRYEDIEKTETTTEVGTLIPSGAKIIDHIMLSPDGTQNYNIFISARNGLTTQFMRGKKVDGKWLFASKVFIQGNKFTPDKKLWEQVDAGFPAKNGQVDWDTDHRSADQPEPMPPPEASTSRDTPSAQP